MLTFQVGGLLKKPEGTKELHQFDEQAAPIDRKGLTPDGHMTGEVSLLNLMDQVHVEVKNAELPIRAQCTRCLKSFKTVVHLPTVSREFFLEMPDDPEKAADNFLIDAKTATIDLAEMLRQDFLLHSPDYPVCSDRCKGICGICGRELNKKACSCQKEPTGERPFSRLKSLLSHE